MGSNKIYINIDDAEIEEYEKEDRNIVCVNIIKDGKILNDNGYIVELILSREAMTGLATQLLRKVYRKEAIGILAHLHKSEPNFSTVSMGVYLHPGSHELIIASKDMGSLEDVFGSRGTLPVSEITPPGQ